MLLSLIAFLVSKSKILGQICKSLCITIGLYLTFVNPAFSQEIKLSVTIKTDQLSGSEFDHLSGLKSVIEEYVNTRKWTEDKYEEFERIRANMQINILQGDTDFNLTASVVIQSERPIFNTLQTTPIITILDNNWSFSYPPNKSVIYDEFQFDDIASFIDFYVYIILGFDYDTFAPNSGSPYYKKASDLAELAQSSSSATGWARSTRQSRSLIITSILSPTYETVRTAYYRYHRLGLDLFTQNQDVARKSLLTALKEVNEAKKKTTDTYIYDLFFNTKYREITAIFLDGELQQRLEAYDFLINIDPGHITEYDKLTQ